MQAFAAEQRTSNPPRDRVAADGSDPTLADTGRPRADQGSAKAGLTASISPPYAVGNRPGHAEDGNQADQFGVGQLELYHNADGAVYCLLEGPDKDAIRRHHAALGVPCGDIHQVESLT